jgi:hypothetical protein
MPQMSSRQMHVWISATAALFCLFSSCDAVRTIWSDYSKSPDGRWIASAHSEESRGPGINFVKTVVELKRVDDPDHRTQILLFDHQTDTVGLQMKWLSPTHLDVTYNQHASLDFQVVKCAGIEISVRDLSATHSP